LGVATVRLDPDNDPQPDAAFFPGLRLEVAALLAGRQRVLAVLQKGLRSPEQVAFVQKLART
jgi:hypothetical protein